jgi:hypothetical protein
VVPLGAAALSGGDECRSTGQVEGHAVTELGKCCECSVTKAKENEVRKSTRAAIHQIREADLIATSPLSFPHWLVPYIVGCLSLTSNQNIKLHHGRRRVSVNVVEELKIDGGIMMMYAYTAAQFSQRSGSLLLEYASLDLARERGFIYTGFF